MKKYGFHKARKFFLIIDGREYDSKAIVGAAYGYQFPEKGPLAYDDFRGGAISVQPLLESLGFTVRVTKPHV